MILKITHHKLRDKDIILINNILQIVLSIFVMLKIQILVNIIKSDSKQLIENTPQNYHFNFRIGRKVNVGRNLVLYLNTYYI